eukprot:CAMPEP_0172533700 /NCGR_PEP_ID=MMETSP1067-20121228/6312_1 /TAXON_ID=265564 ORGANISM="Thalassiosira punctigera, Strain Tpunct2005C2" /NCGR_SAMPLE_ID=MMETSP1067 /ASSEMBLY_ACC=CAM_ASM_000444 /LENGTH=152 /DNA_ID=CAMNT_0013318373 /DNA_START=144 /DNA_END=599 /DNA_ORIENTATION=+
MTTHCGCSGQGSAAGVEMPAIKAETWSSPSAARWRARTADSSAPGRFEPPSGPTDKGSRLTWPTPRGGWWSTWRTQRRAVGRRGVGIRGWDPGGRPPGGLVPREEAQSRPDGRDARRRSSRQRQGGDAKATDRALANSNSDDAADEGRAKNG